MKIITRKKQVEIAKRLAAIYYTTAHWQDEKWEDFAKCIIGNVCDISYDVGGEPMKGPKVYGPLADPCDLDETYQRDDDGWWRR